MDQYHVHLARRYLQWFSREAREHSINNPDGTSSIEYDGAHRYTVAYTGKNGRIRWTQFVSSIANVSLGPVEASKVYQAADAIVSRSVGYVVVVDPENTIGERHCVGPSIDQEELRSYMERNYPEGTKWTIAELYGFS